MRKIEQKGAFLTEVTNHIKSKEAKDLVATELNFHLKQAKNMWMDKGLSEEVAEDKAVEQMGSQLNWDKNLTNCISQRLIGFNWFISGCDGVRVLPVIAFGYMNDLLMDKVIFVVLGIATALGMMLINYRKLEIRMVVLYNWCTYLVNAILLSECWDAWRTDNKSWSYCN